MNQTAKLYYFVHTQNLVFKSDQTGKWVYIKALTGGGRGQKVDGEPLPYGHNNSRMFTSLSERDKAHGTYRGGPLPHGVYKIGVPLLVNFAAAGERPKMVKCCRLSPTGQNMYHRDNFYIHGQGEHGSDGCIVPLCGKVQDVFTYISTHHGGALLVETSERHGIDYDYHFAARFGAIA